MNEELNSLITALREELTQYGEVLALMQEQQQFIINRSANELLLNLNVVNEQMEKVSVARNHREACRRALVATLNATEETTFYQMTEMLPSEVQPLLKALVEEINQLLQHIQKWLRQNHMLLSRSLDLMKQIMKGMFPSSSSTAGTYGRGGQVSPVTPPPSTLYEGII
jgi:flagellar biosynthesis/type III secretory pathway chaperone